MTRSLPMIAWVFLASCALPLPVARDTIRMELSAEPDTLNPITASDAYAALIDGYVNDTLIERNRDTLEFTPKMAERWEISLDRLQYTFYLRRGIRWHDGVPFTADDVVYSFTRIKDPQVEAPFQRVYYTDVERVEKIDDHTVRFITTRPYFLGLSVCGGIALAAKHVFDNGENFNSHLANRHPVGVGPYRFVTWKTNKEIVLERNEDYWGDKPAIRRIELKVVTEDAVSLQLLKKAELDYASLSPIQWVKQTGSPKFDTLFQKYKYLSPGYNYIGWNNKKPFFKDRRVRRALTHLINREKILEKINFGLGVVVSGPAFVDSPQYDASIAPWPYHMDTARVLLSEAGWRDTDGDGVLDKEGLKFEFTFLYPSASKFSERVAPILKEDLMRVGIVMHIERMEWAAFLERINKREFDATAMGWSMGFEGDPFQIWHSSQAKEANGSNFISFENPEVDRLIEAARAEFDTAKRNAIYHQFHRILHEEQPYTFMFASNSLVAVSQRFAGVKVHKTGLNLLEWRVK